MASNRGPATPGTLPPDRWLFEHSGGLGPLFPLPVPPVWASPTCQRKHCGRGRGVGQGGSGDPAGVDAVACGGGVPCPRSQGRGGRHLGAVPPAPETLLSGLIFPCNLGA